MEILKLLNPDNTVSFNRHLAHAIGLNETIIYSALISKQVWYERNSMLTPDGWFYSTVEDLHESTCLSGYQQNRCISRLVKLGLILCRKRGIPARRYFCVPDEPELLRTFLPDTTADQETPESRSDNSAACDADTSRQEVKKIENKECSLSAASHEDSSHKTKASQTTIKETKENNFKPQPQSEQFLSARERLGADRLTEKYGEIFSDLVCRTVADGISGKFRLHRNGRIISLPEVISAYKRINHEHVCHVADYIAENNGVIRSIPAYLRTALYTTVEEEWSGKRVYDDYSSDWQDLRGGMFRQWVPLKRRDSSIDLDDVMDELREQYTS